MSKYIVESLCRAALGPEPHNVNTDTRSQNSRGERDGNFLIQTVFVGKLHGQP